LVVADEAFAAGVEVAVAVISTAAMPADTAGISHSNRASSLVNP
jgi:hypothetical protein